MARRHSQSKPEPPAQWYKNPMPPGTTSFRINAYARHFNVPQYAKSDRNVELCSFVTIMPGVVQEMLLEADFHIPKYAKEPFEYSFDYGEVAWALHTNGLWQRVLVISEGHWQTYTKGNDSKLYRFWYCKYPTGPDRPGVKRQCYAPMLGEIKPDYPFVRRLLYQEDVLSEEDRKDVEQEIIRGDFA